MAVCVTRVADMATVIHPLSAPQHVEPGTHVGLGQDECVSTCSCAAVLVVQHLLCINLSEPQHAATQLAAPRGPWPHLATA
jgi:hypothetical protein